MTQKVDVDDFVSQEKLAVVGVSRKKMKFGSVVYRELKKRGYRVFPVNPHMETLGEDPCYADLKALPETVGGAVLVIPPAKTEEVVKEVKEAGIPRVWMQLGAESKKAVEYCKENDIKVITDECIMMFIEPVNHIHKFHRWIWKLFRKLPN
jgi:predicted CoA-binding protein